MYMLCTDSMVYRHLLSPVIEKTRFVSLDNHNIKQVPPVLPHNVVHSSVPGKDKDYLVSNILKAHHAGNKYLS